MNEQIKELENALRAELKIHDWYYLDSDDGRIWRAGEARSKKIEALFVQYKQAVGANQAHSVWNEYAPGDFQLTQNGEAS